MNSNSDKPSKGAILNELESIRESLSVDTGKAKSGNGLDKHVTGTDGAHDIPVLTMVADDKSHANKKPNDIHHQEFDFEFELDDDVLIHDDMPLIETSMSEQQHRMYSAPIDSPDNDLAALQAAYRNEELTLINHPDTDEVLNTSPLNDIESDTLLPPLKTPQPITRENPSSLQFRANKNRDTSLPMTQSGPLDQTRTDDYVYAGDSNKDSLESTNGESPTDHRELSHAKPQSAITVDTRHQHITVQTDADVSLQQSDLDEMQNATNNPFLPPHIRERLGKHNEIISQFKEAEREATETLSILKASVSKTTAASQNAEEAMAQRDQHRADIEHQELQKSSEAKPLTQNQSAAQTQRSSQYTNLIDELVEELTPLIKAKLRAKLKDLDLDLDLDNAWKNPH